MSRTPDTDPRVIALEEETADIRRNASRKYSKVANAHNDLVAAHGTRLEMLEAEVKALRRGPTGTRNADEHVLPQPALIEGKPVRERHIALTSSEMRFAVSLASKAELERLVLELYKNGSSRMRTHTETMLPSRKTLKAHREARPVAAASLKQKAQEMEDVTRICKLCGQDFSIEEEVDEDCMKHEGTKQVDWDSDFWADHDERCHGPPDALIDDSDYEDGMIWDCCESSGDDPICESHAHELIYTVSEYM